MESASFPIPAEVFVSAARVTAVYAILFIVVLTWQGMAKLGMAVKALSKKEHFDRCDFALSCLCGATNYSMDVMNM